MCFILKSQVETVQKQRFCNEKNIFYGCENKTKKSACGGLTPPQETRNSLNLTTGDKNSSYGGLDISLQYQHTGEATKATNAPHQLNSLNHTRPMTVRIYLSNLALFSNRGFRGNLRITCHQRVGISRGKVDALPRRIDALRVTGTRWSTSGRI